VTYRTQIIITKFVLKYAKFNEQNRLTCRLKAHQTAAKEFNLITSAVIDNTRHWYRACLLLVLVIESTKKKIPMNSHVYVLQTTCTTLGDCEVYEYT
jgi:hypothetical protein